MQKTSLKSYGTRTDKAMKTVVRLDRVSYKIYNIMVNYLAEHNLTFNQFKVLEVLYHRGDLNVSAITKLTMSTPGNITVVIKNLKRDGWITSIKDPNDNRASILTITQKGEEIIQKVFPQHSINLKNCMEVLSDEELETLYELLDKVYKTN
ncbi:MarR family winged helix-turn-helix transcriptional regulator [Malaciobacter mytili]|uniref:MarR family transcriptional regulator n=1 Tax=Malaciobacter mytili LMG 24559 TaxID=1032238 RepID=A0AAX2ADG8_9BACT|nr:MarR family transcriptional regulator [Malaciobacter mytili]AXH13643.1 transcriptional regulator, MarR family [Malaciobacter mytili LMG 24559]RXI44672.1 MarR family transcriptional regulator [Malaciobacter mytili]RXK13827.1 MarR family transcriptional regulator [Malaciobacter mytili LMG 24559]